MWMHASIAIVGSQNQQDGHAQPDHKHQPGQLSSRAGSLTGKWRRILVSSSSTLSLALSLFVDVLILVFFSFLFLGIWLAD